MLQGTGRRQSGWLWGYKFLIAGDNFGSMVTLGENSSFQWWALVGIDAT